MKELQKFWKKSKILNLILIVVVGVLGGFMCFKAQKYEDEKQKIYSEKIVELKKILKTEQKWIRNNQSKEGAIYMNTSPESFTGDVNPYFSAQAGMGLLTKNPSKENLKAVRRYLTWHTKVLLKSDGIVSNYRLEGIYLKPTKEYDSIDAYIASYLNLLSEYGKNTGSISDIPESERALYMCLKVLSQLTVNQLTRVSYINGTQYFMDNVEVFDACSNVYQFLKTTEESELTREYETLKNRYRQGIYLHLWNYYERRFEIGLNDNGKPFPYDDWKPLYPNGISQIYEISCKNFFKKSREFNQLYENFCSMYDWENMNIDDEFNWPVIAYIATQMKDYQRAEQYLMKYEKKYSENREYPLHTADAAWVARTADALIQEYEKKLDNKNILVDIWDFLME